MVSGSVISTHYDPMLAKVIAYAPTRGAAARRLATALAGTRVHGPVTNRDQLVATLRHEAFLAGATDTGFLDRHDTTGRRADAGAVRLSALAAALAQAAANRAEATVLDGLPSGWRNVPSQPQRVAFDDSGTVHEVAYRLTRTGLVAEGHEDVSLVSASPDAVVLTAAWRTPAVHGRPARARGVRRLGARRGDVHAGRASARPRRAGGARHPARADARLGDPGRGERGRHGRAR